MSDYDILYLQDSAKVDNITLESLKERLVLLRKDTTLINCQATRDLLETYIELVEQRIDELENGKK